MFSNLFPKPIVFGYFFLLAYFGMSALYAFLSS
jgi:hypothetical protein